MDLAFKVFMAPKGQESNGSGLRITSGDMEPEVQDNTFRLFLGEGKEREAEIAKSRTKEIFFFKWEEL